METKQIVAKAFDLHKQISKLSLDEQENVVGFLREIINGEANAVQAKKPDFKAAAMELCAVCCGNGILPAGLRKVFEQYLTPEQRKYVDKCRREAEEKAKKSQLEFERRMETQFKR